MSRSRLYRSGFVWRTDILIVGALVVVCALAALLSTRLASRLVPAGLCVFELGMLAWASRLGVRADDNGVRIINMLRRPTFQWNEIERFELAPGGIYPFVGWVVLTNQRKIAITAITVSKFAKARSLHSAQTAIDALNELRAASRQDSTAHDH